MLDFEAVRIDDGSVWRAVLATVAVWLSASLLGRCWRQPLEEFSYDRLARVGLRLALGLVVLGVIAQLLSACRVGWLGAPVIMGLAAIEIGWLSTTLLAARPWWTQSAMLGTQLVQALKDHWAWLGLAFVTAGAALGAPEAWDELVYHLPAPLRWHQLGYMPALDDLPYSGFPGLPETVFWLSAGIEIQSAPRAICWGAWLIGLGLLASTIRALGLSPLQVQCWLLVLGITDTMLLISGGCYVESIVLMYTAATLRWILAACKSVPTTVAQATVAQATVTQATVLAVLCAGAAAVKLTGVGLICLPLAFMVLARRRLSYFVAFGIIYAGVLFIFYQRPGWYTGNPLYPYFEPWFTNDAARVATSQFHHALGAAFGVQGVIASAMSPILLAFSQSVFDGSFGWQLIVWLVLAIWAMRYKHTPADARSQQYFTYQVIFLASGLGMFALWAATAQQARFAIPAVVCIWIAAAALLSKLTHDLRKKLIAATVVLALFSAPWPTANYYLATWAERVGLAARQQGLEEALGEEYWSAVAAIERFTPSDSHVLLLFEHRSLYIPRRCTLGTPFFQSAMFTPPEEYSHAAAIDRQLRERAISHVLLAVAQPGPDFSPQWAERLPPFLEGLSQSLSHGNLELLWESGRYKLLRKKGSGLFSAGGN